MFEAYKVAVRLSLINRVTPALGTMALGIHKLGGDVDKLQGKLDKLKLVSMGGGVIAGAGAAGIGVLSKMLEPAKEYAHQLNIINMAGLTHIEQAQAIGDAWKNTKTVITTTATENLRSLLDMKNVFGTLDEARSVLPMASKMQAVLAAATEGKSNKSAADLAYEASKALDVIGAATDPEKFKKQFEMMGKVMVATQGRVTPEMFKSFFVYARQGAPMMSDEYKYQIVPTLMQEMAGKGGGGGGSKGLGPSQAALYRVISQGYINKKSLPLIEKLGLISSNTALKTTTQGTTVGHFKGWQLANQNAFEWTQKILLPAIRKEYGQNVSKEVINDVIGQIFRGNQGAAWLVGQFANKEVNFLRDQQNIIHAKGVNDAYKSALSDDPNTVEKALGSQWTNFQTALMMGVVPILIPALTGLTTAFNSMAVFFRAHPTLAKAIAIGLGGIFTALVLGGSIMVSVAAFRAIGLVFGGLASIAPGIAIAGTAIGKMSALFSPMGIAAGAAAFGIQQAYQAFTTGNSMVYSLLSKLGASLTGDKNWTLGGQIYDWTHKAYDPNAKTSGEFPRLGGNQQMYHWQHPASAADVKKMTQVDVHIDGKKVARAVFDQAGNQASGPMSGASGMNGAAMLLPPNLAGNW